MSFLEHFAVTDSFYKFFRRVILETAIVSHLRDTKKIMSADEAGLQGVDVEADLQG
jgi:hypothetical protein